MRMIHSGLFAKLEQAGINDRFSYGYTWKSGVWYVQKEFPMGLPMLFDTLSGVSSINKILKMGFPNKRISCKRKRRAQYS